MDAADPEKLRELTTIERFQDKMTDVDLIKVVCYFLFIINVCLGVKIVLRTTASVYLKYAVLWTVIGWNLPILTYPFVSNRLALSLEESSFYQGYFIELAGMCLLLLCVTFFQARHAGSLQERSEEFEISPTAGIIISTIALTAFFVFSPVRDSYLFENLRPVQTAIEDQGKDMVTAFIRSVTLAFAIVMTGESIKDHFTGFWVKGCGWAIIIMSAVQDLVSGGRIAFVLPFAVYVINHLKRGKGWLQIGITGLIFVLLAPAVFVGMGIVRSEFRYTADDILTQMDFVMRKDWAEQVQDLMFQVHTKLDNASYGQTLLAFEPPGSGGFFPIISAMYAFVPRVLIPAKPWGGSRDGTAAGHPSRLAGGYAGGSEAVNVGIGPVQISVWQLGYVAGIAVFVISNLLQLAFLNMLLSRDRLAMKITGVWMLGLPLCHKAVTSLDLIIVNCAQALFLLLGLKIVSVFGDMSTKRRGDE